MIIGTCMITLRIPWASSLKDKRMVVKSLTDKMKHKFNISVAEVEEQDNHRVAVIGFACVTNQNSHTDSIIENVISFVENNTEAEITDVFRENL